VRSLPDPDARQVEIVDLGDTVPVLRLDEV
jgi:hypothetical protein